MHKLITVLAGSMLLIVIFCPSETTGAETASFNELVKKARAEGQVEFWDSTDQDSAEEVLAVFAKRYGIKTKYRFWRGTGVQQRTLIELQSGRSLSADLMSPGREAQQQFLEAGVFQNRPTNISPFGRIWTSGSMTLAVGPSALLGTHGRSLTIPNLLRRTRCRRPGMTVPGRSSRDARSSIRATSSTPCTGIEENGFWTGLRKWWPTTSS